jgi:hypothetical protein
VAPDRAELHAAERSPHVLPGGDLAAIEDDGAVGRHHLIRNRGRELVDPGADPPEDGKRQDEDGGEGDPETLHGKAPGDSV